jgi:hypothetical protein
MLDTLHGWIDVDVHVCSINPDNAATVHVQMHAAGGMLLTPPPASKASSTLL